MHCRLVSLFAGGVCLLWLGSFSPVQAEVPSVEPLPQQVQTLLKNRCGKCHGGSKPKARLDLESLAGVSRGNKRGAVVVPNQPGDSLLWEVIADERMPPEDPLPETERLLLKQWIEQGAPGLIATANGHWAFQPVTRPDIPDSPEVPGLTTIDRFLGRKLFQHKLTFRPEADRATLIRRVCFDLTGLPPSPQAIDEFIADPSSAAYEAMVDRYLASPRYGERWGKYWLDLSGYADSNGYFNADSVRPLAYRYRDYVIDSFNRDKPYDEFVREQLAGDELAGYVAGGDVTPEMVERLTATQFLRNAQDGTNESDGNADELLNDRYSVLEGNLQIAMNTLLGLTIQCARCHSHKFEPISHEEYYRLEAILYAAYLPEKWVKGNSRVTTVGTREERERHAQQTELVNRQIAALKAGLEQMIVPLREGLIVERLKALPGEQQAPVLAAYRQPADKRTEAQQQLLKTHEKLLAVADKELAERFPEIVPLREQVAQAVTARERDRPAPLPVLSILADVTPTPPPHHLLLRGLHNSPGPEVEPGVLAALTVPENAYHIDTPSNPQTTGRRTAFARWVTSRHNPLFARVMVNRVWQYHFGTGLVSTPDNLGQSGAVPSHPQLLDYLADEFVRQGWSLKALHRLILTSAAYRQESREDEIAAQVDPGNRLLWRYPLRRLDAEAIRDSMLQISGELDPTPGGPFIPTTRAADGTVLVEEAVAGSHRRSVYLQQRRTQMLTFLELFDAPTIVSTCSFRTQSTVPLQSLTLMNSDFVRRRSQAFAKRLLSEAKPNSGAETEGVITQAFRLACGRVPAPEEIAAAKTFLETQQQLHATAPDARQRAWTDFCQMLLASNSFLYVD